MGDVHAALDALRSKDGGIGAELVTERASSLGRAGRKLDAAIATCRAALVVLEQAPAASRAEALDTYRRAHEEAHEARWEMIVIRECLGLWPHTDVDAHWQIPAAR
jgi:hypothetical protein